VNIGPLSKRRKKNNSSRDELYEKTARYTWTDYKKNTKIGKGNITPVLDRIQEYRRDWLQHINRIDCSRLPRIVKNKQQVEEQGRPLKRLPDA
jgi:hypothetical protein